MCEVNQSRLKLTHSVVHMLSFVTFLLGMTVAMTSATLGLPPESGLCLENQMCPLGHHGVYSSVVLARLTRMGSTRGALWAQGGQGLGRRLGLQRLVTTVSLVVSPTGGGQCFWDQLCGIS